MVNIQNVSIHEKTHFKDKVLVEGAAHSKSYKAQIKHPTFRNVTPEFRKETLDALKAIMAGTL